MPPPLTISARVRLTGFVTKALLLRGRNQSTLEASLGYKSKRLSAGYWLLFLDEMPTAADFEFGGYTHFSDGKPVDDLGRQTWTVEQSLASTGHLAHHKARVIRDVFRVDGPERLAKIIPLSGPTGEKDFPPGSGVPQWRIAGRGLWFRVVAEIKPGEAYQGNYR